MTRFFVFIYFTLILYSCLSCSHEKTTLIDDEIVVSNILSNNSISGFTEDNDGHIWIATMRGVNKYYLSGYRQFFISEDDSGLPSNVITAIYNDSNGRLWVSTQDGTCLYGEDGEMHRVVIEENDNNNNRVVYDIKETKSGDLYFASSGKLLKENPQNGNLEIVSTYHNNNSKVCLNVSSDGNLWLTYGPTIEMINPNDYANKIIIRVPYQINHSCIMPNGQLWVVGQQNLTIVDPISKQTIEIPEVISNNTELMFADLDYVFPFDGTNILINSAKQGLFCYNWKEQTIIHQNDPDFPFKAPSFRIRTIYKDTRDNIWLGSEDQGYEVVYKEKDQFSERKSLTSFFEGKSVLSLAVDADENLWVATLKDGVYVYNYLNETIKQIDLKPIVPSTKDLFASCKEIITDSQGNIFFLFENLRYVQKCKYDGKTLIVQESYQFPEATTVSMDEDGGIWIGGKSIYVRYYKDGDYQDFNVLQDEDWSYVNNIIPLKDNQVLIAAYGLPLIVIDVMNNHVVRELFSENDLDYCFKKPIFHPTSLKKLGSNLMIGTFSNGLMRYDSNTAYLEPILGLACNDICSVEEDSERNLWISTLNGLSKYVFSTGNVSNYFKEDGIKGNQFYERSSCQLPDGLLAFGGTHGITCLNPIVNTHTRDVPIVFENLKIHNHIVRPGLESPISKDMTHNPDITIKHHQNSFSIAFSALDYSDNVRPIYQYKLEGFNTDWIDAGNNREAYYANLPTGKYMFKVRISSNNNSIIGREQSLNIKILPPIWATWYAYLIYLTIICYIAYFIIGKIQAYNHEKKIAEDKVREEEFAKLLLIKEKEQIQNLNQQQMMFFSNVAHEFRTPLTMIYGPAETLEKSKNMNGKDKRLLSIIRKNSSWMLLLVNQLLDFNRINNTIIKLKVEKKDIVNTLLSIKDIFSFNAEAKGISLETSGMEDSFVTLMDEDKIVKIVINLISNAIKYTPKGGRVVLSFDVIPQEDAQLHFPLADKDISTQYVKITVEDTGPGIPENELEKIFEKYYQIDSQNSDESKMGSGIGLYYARSLVNSHHGYIKANNINDNVSSESGAIFSFIIPISDESYTDEEKHITLSSNNIEPSKLVVQSTVCDTKPEGTKKIIVVDDDVTMTDYLKLLLSDYYAVYAFYDAQSALKSIDEIHPELIVTDISMPGKSGYELCKRIKTNIHTCHIPVVLLTAKTMIEDKIKGMEVEADAFLTKPFEPDYLLAMLKSIINNRDRIRHIISTSTDVENINEISPQDKAFMQELYSIMEEELSNPELDMNVVTEKLRISRTKLYYKVKDLTGEAPSTFFKSYKLNTAAKLLLSGKYNISEVADMTGFSTLSFFSSSFKKHFGVAPSEYKG